MHNFEAIKNTNIRAPKCQNCGVLNCVFCVAPPPICLPNDGFKNVNFWNYGIITHFPDFQLISYNHHILTQFRKILATLPPPDQPLFNINYVRPSKTAVKETDFGTAT